MPGNPVSEDEKRRFILSNLTRGILWLAAIILLMLLVERFLGDRLETYLQPLDDQPLILFLIFSLSEFFFGIIPVEFFVKWATDAGRDPELVVSYVLLLTVITYTAGWLTFLIGRWVNGRRFFRKIQELETYQKYALLYRKYGGILIVLAALTPIPYATITFISGTFLYKKRLFLFFSLARLLRMALLAWVLPMFQQ